MSDAPRDKFLRQRDPGWTKQEAMSSIQTGLANYEIRFDKPVNMDASIMIMVGWCRYGHGEILSCYYDGESNNWLEYTGFDMLQPAMKFPAFMQKALEKAMEQAIGFEGLLFRTMLSDIKLHASQINSHEGRVSKLELQVRELINTEGK